MKLTKKEQAAILEIAKANIYTVEKRGDLEERRCDSEDFLEDIAVWSLKAALEAAYELGKKNGGK